MSNRNTWLYSGSIAILSAALIAGIATFIDWRINPSGLFHDASGTHWGIVLETFASWFLPIVPAVFLLVLLPLLTYRWWITQKASSQANS